MTHYDYLLIAVEKHAGKDECLLWPYGCTSGYGMVWIENKKQNQGVHTIALEYKLGRSILPELQSCHTCRNRHCFALAHLYEGTQLQNMTDRIVDGTKCNGEKHGCHKLIESEVLEIRDAWSTGLFTSYELADDFNVSQAQIWRIAKRKSWKHI